MTEQENKAETLPTTAQPQLTEPEVQWRLDERKSLALSKASAAVPKAFQGKPADILAAWMMADELGISRMSMLRGAYVVNGKPQLSGDLLIAVARSSGVKVSERIEAIKDSENDIIAICEATLPTGEVITATFSVADAQRAGLWDKSDPWKKYPQRMLQMRARGFCLRDAIPHKLAGVYAPGELIEGDVEG